MSQAGQAQAAASVATLEAASLLDQVLAATRPEDRRERPRDYLQLFLEHVARPGRVVAADVRVNIKFWIGEIDKKLSAQLNEILHHPDFQKLESTWRGLAYLVNQTETGETLKIRVYNAKKHELLKDLEKATEFDQSALFKKVYEEEYGQLGGQPYGLLVGDYEFGRSTDDVSLLKMISNVAAAAHAPFVAAASPGMFGMERWSELTNPRDLGRIFDGIEYAAWKSFRDTEDARYTALALPRVLARLPYGDRRPRATTFQFAEDVSGRNYDRYLWMSAAWAYAARVTEAFARYGWFARTRGVEGGGKVEGLPVQSFPTDQGGVANKSSTEVAISDRREFELSTLGFLPLLHNKGRDFAAFLGSQSCQRPKKYQDAAATANAELSAKFNLMLCTSRFAHYLKVMARDKIGGTMEISDCSRWLNDWLKGYVVGNPDNASEETKARKPLSDASVEMRPVKGKPGFYEAVAYLRPHYQMEALTTSMRLVAEVPKKT